MIKKYFHLMFLTSPARIIAFVCIALGLSFNSANANVEVQTPHLDTLNAPQNIHTEQSSKIEVSELIFDHVKDGHEFHFFTYKEFHATIPLPIVLYSPQRGWNVFMSSHFHHGHEAYMGYRLSHGKIIPVDDNGNDDVNVVVYDYSLTRNAVQLFIVCILTLLILLNVSKQYQKHNSHLYPPKGLAGFIEPIILFVKTDVVEANLGVHKGAKYIPFLLSVFFFILFNNIFGLIPGSANVTGNISFTLTLSVFSFITIMISSGKHFWAHTLWPEGPIFVKIILIPIEFIGIFTKPFALMVRLFANMLAGHIIIICFISLIFIFGALGGTTLGFAFSPVSMVFTIFIYVIEVLVAFIQAFIFTNLTTVFISQVIEPEHHHEAIH